MKNSTLVFLTSIMCQYAFAEQAYVFGDLLGRMGNYLFEVAAASALAWDHDAIPYFPHLNELKPSNKLRSRVLFRCNKIHPPASLRIQHEWATPATGYKPIVYKPNMLLKGYSQSLHYFAHHREKLIKLFAPHPKDLRHIKKKYPHILNHPNTVSVHVRHYDTEVPGDSFLQFNEDYYEKAMSLFPSESTLFVVTSDDISYAEKIIPSKNRNITFVKNEIFTVDFHIQRLCKHNIIANSSFSWWSAWLNEHQDKIVVRPKRWLAGYEELDSPEEWIRIDATCLQDTNKGPAE